MKFESSDDLRTITFDASKWAVAFLYAMLLVLCYLTRNNISLLVGSICVVAVATLGYVLLPYRIVIDGKKGVVVRRSLFGKELDQTLFNQCSSIEVIKNDWTDSDGDYWYALTLAVTGKAAIKLKGGYSKAQAKESAEFLRKFFAESGTKLPLRFKSSRKD